MTELNQSISNVKIKVRWDEPYVSEALNRQIATVPPGLFSGGNVDYSTATQLRIWGGIFLLRDDVNGFGLLVRDTAQTLIDCSSIYPAVGDQAWYVGVSATYETGVETVGKYFFTDSPPTANQLTGKSGLVYYQVNIHDGDTGLDQADFSDLFSSAKPTPYPLRGTQGSVLSTDRDLGLITNVQAYSIPTKDEKDGLVGYPTAPTSSNKLITQGLLSSTVKGVCRDVSYTINSGRIQLSGFIYVGKGNGTTPMQYLSLWDSVLLSKPATTGANGSKIRVISAYLSDDATPLVPSVHADANGYCENPVFYCTTDEGAPSGVGVILSYIERTNLGSEPTYYSSPAGMGPFRLGQVEDVLSKAFESISGRWSFPSTDRLDDTLKNLLDAVDSLHVDDRSLSGSTSWKLLYRNNSELTDDNLPAGSQSIYSAYGGYMVLTGPVYASVDHIYSSSNAAGETASILVLINNTVFLAISGTLTASADLGYVSINSWDLDDNGYWYGFYTRFASDNWHMFGKDLELGTSGSGRKVVSKDRFSPFLRVSVSDGGGSSNYGHSAAMTNGYNTLYMANALFDPVADTFERCRNDRTIDDASALLLRPAVGNNLPNVVGAYLHRGTDGDDWDEDEWISMGGFTRPATNVDAASGGGCFSTTGRAILSADGTASLGKIGNGILIATDESNDQCGVYVVSGGAVVAALHTNAYFTNTMDNAGTINVYGNTVQNKNVGSKTVTWGVFMAKFLTTTGSYL